MMHRLPDASSSLEMVARSFKQISCVISTDIYNSVSKSASPQYFAYEYNNYSMICAA